MPRFPIGKKFVSKGGKVLRGIISPSDYSHITKVLRLKPGDRITVFDEECFEYHGVISNIYSGTIELCVDDFRSVETESPLELNLFQAILKGSRMDGVIRQTTQLGVSGIFPVISERTQVRKTDKADRWNKIALESIKQCGRSNAPIVSQPIDFSTSLKTRSKSELKIVFHEKHNELLCDYMNSRSAEVKSINVLIGPEGGFSDAEVSSAEENGYNALGLGKRILRAETASVVSLALLQSYFGDI